MRNYIIAIIKTIYFNLKCFNIKTAIKLPVYIGANVHFYGLYQGCICIDSTIKKGMISIGRSYGSNRIDRGVKSILIFNKYGSIIIHGKASFCSEFKLKISGTLELGENFEANNNFNCICYKYISFGKNCLLGWDITIIDSDGHTIYVNKRPITNTIPINIGNNVWIGAKATILKGSQIQDDSIIGYGTIVSGKYESNSIIIGNKGKMINKDNLQWKK